MEEIVRIVAKGKVGRVEHIVSHGEGSPEGFWYDQQEDEYAAVVRGEAALMYTDGVRTLRQGDLEYIPAHKRHRVAYTSPDCEWICFFAAEAEK